MSSFNTSIILCKLMPENEWGIVIDGRAHELGAFARAAIDDIVKDNPRAPIASLNIPDPLQPDPKNGLMPCPFCGSGAGFHTSRCESGSHDWWVECINCDARGPRETVYPWVEGAPPDGKAAAAASWNKRES